MSQTKIRIDRLLLLGIVLAFVGLGVLYSFVNPLFESPDEHWHFAFVKQLVDHGELPLQPPERYPHAAGQEASQPPIYYLVGALVVRWIDTSDFNSLLWSNDHWAFDTMNRHNDNKNRFVHPPEQALSFTGTALAVRLLRWLSVLFGVVTVLCTYGLARQILPRQAGLALAAAALVAFTPQFIFINSSVTNDSAAAALASAYLFLLVRGLRSGVSWWGALVLGLVLGLALLTKLSALMLIPLTALGFGLHALLAGGRKDQPITTTATGAPPLLALILCLVVAGLMGGWWYVRNWLLYGEPLGSEMMLQIFGRRQPVPGLLDLLSEFPRIQETFWAAFGWSNVLVDQWIYYALYVLVGLSALGLLMGLARKSRPLLFALQKRDWCQPDLATASYLGLALIWFLLVFASLLQWMRSTTAPYGRLLYPAIAAIALLLVYGLGQLSPVNARRYLQAVLVGLFLLFSVVAPFRYIAPAYSKPPTFGPSASLAASHPSSLVFGDEIELLGYDLAPEPMKPEALTEAGWSEIPVVSPGQMLKLTLYWRPRMKIPKDYTVFVQLLDSSWSSLGQRDTYPGLGNYPTSLWTAGVGVRDVYYVPVAANVDTPVLATLQVGLYDQKTMQRLPALRGGKTTEDSPGLARVKIVSVGHETTPPNRLTDRFANGITLEGYRLDMGTVPATTAGSSASSATREKQLSVTLYWRADQPVPKDYTVFTQILSPGGTVVAQHDSQPKGGNYPTSVWAAREQIVDQHLLLLPSELPAGNCQLRVGLYDPATGERVTIAEGGLADQSLSIPVPESLLGKGGSGS